MSDLLQTIATYVPPSIIQATLAASRPLPPNTAQKGYIEAAILFADVSGFTPLTEALAQKGAEGPEELTRLLNGYFSRMIALIEAEGGEVVKFSGDAVTVVFPVREETLAHAVRRAKQAADAMQAAMTEFTTLPTSVGPVALGMKIGIGAGQILAAHVGGIRGRWEYVIAGDPLRQVAEAEHQAERGQIVLSPEAQALIFPDLLSPRTLPQPDWDQIKETDQVEAVLRCYVPGAVTSWLQQELQAWLAVLRPMSVLFIGIGGLDYAQDDAIDRLHTFLRAAQETIYNYEGSINKLAVDDKGTIFIALFGAPPFAHEDDPERALRCALDLQAVAQSQGLQLAVGATTGRVFAGPVGSDTRREYTVMGDTVNLAARLMGKAGLGEIRCDHETYRLTQARMTFDELAPVRLKGKAGLIPLYRPLGRSRQDVDYQTQSILVGRHREMTKFRECLDDVEVGKSRILILEGEAGIGKSRLVEELQHLTHERGLVSLLGMGLSIERQKPYRAWRDIFALYFGLDDIKDPLERQQHIQNQVLDLVPDLAESTPLLDDVLSLGLPENDLTASLSTELRHDSLVSLLLALLRVWATERPLVLILEDAHWLDSLSWDLTVQVARALTVAHTPLFLVVAMRPMRGDAMRMEPVNLMMMEEAEQLQLDLLSPDETVDLATTRLGLSKGDLPELVAELVRDRAGGNPFFAEELIYTLRDNGLITITTEAGQTRCEVSGDLVNAVRTLPDTIQGIVLSRIDRLPPEEQLALKVAAVIGRTFGYNTLYDTLNQYATLAEQRLKSYLDDLRHLDLTPLEAPEPELTYIFKHIITQEVAYSTLLFAQRRQLHERVASWFEQKLSDGSDTTPPKEGLAPFHETPLTPFYPLLVHHWRQAEEQHRERHYAWLAGRRAAAQFANEDAADYLSRALELTPDTDIEAQYQLLLAREAVNDLRGEREVQAQDLATLSKLTAELDNPQRRIEVALRQANYTEKISDYPASLAAAQSAVEQAAQIQDLSGQIEGQIAWGKVLWRQGDYDEAREILQQALATAEASQNHYGEARSLYYIGHAFLYQNNYPDAQNHFRQALETYHTSGHRQNEGDSLNILGVTYAELQDYPKARDYYDRALAIYRTIGDREGEAIILSNFGNLYCDLGDYAASRDYQEQALDLRFIMGNRAGEANSLTNLGLVYHCLGQQDAARDHCQRAITIQREIGDRRTKGYSFTYLAHALTDLGDLDEATATYQKAMNLRRELGQDSLAIDDLAGLARVAMARNDHQQALTHIEEILAWLEENGPDGIEYPFQVYLTCYHVLAASTEDRQEQARTILAEAHTMLLDQANGITDPDLRRSFLENVAANREILEIWAAMRGEDQKLWNRRGDDFQSHLPKMMIEGKDTADPQPLSDGEG